MERVFFQPNFSSPPLTFETMMTTKPDTSMAVMFPARRVSVLVEEAKVRPEDKHKMFLSPSKNQNTNRQHEKKKQPAKPESPL